MIALLTLLCVQDTEAARLARDLAGIKQEMDSVRERMATLSEQIKGIPDKDTNLYADKCVDLQSTMARYDILRVRYVTRCYKRVEYDFLVGGNKTGSLTLASREAGASVLFEDKLSFEDGGHKHDAVTAIQCMPDPHLTLEAAATSMDGVVKRLVANHGRATIGKDTVDLAANATVGYSFLRRLALMPAKEGAVLAFDNFSFDGLRLDKGFVASFSGPQKIKRGEKEVEVDVWKLSAPEAKIDGAIYVLDSVAVRVEIGAVVLEKRE